VTGIGLQSLLAVVLVLGLVGALALVARRGGFGALTKRGPVTVETAVPLGDRRQLVIVAVEGRRLLLGLTAASVSMITELQPSPAVPATATHAFEQELAKRT
jgi:flagellar biogenesis protein FliO